MQHTDLLAFLSQYQCFASQSTANSHRVQQFLPQQLVSQLLTNTVDNQIDISVLNEVITMQSNESIQEIADETSKILQDSEILKREIDHLNDQINQLKQQQPNITENSEIFIRMTDSIGQCINSEILTSNYALQQIQQQFLQSQQQKCEITENVIFLKENSIKLNNILQNDYEGQKDAVLDFQQKLRKVISRQRDMIEAGQSNEHSMMLLLPIISLVFTLFSVISI